MYLKSIAAILVALLAWFLFKRRHEILFPRYEMSFRKVAKTADVTGPWSLKHRNFAVYALRGRRPYMEDRFDIIDNEETGEDLYWAFAIYDGHGGSFFCDYAERHLLKAITRSILGSAAWDLNVTQVLIDEFLKFDEQSMKIGGAGRNMCGTTALVGIHYKRKLYFANTGDSRAVAKQYELREIIETIDHKPDMPEELARIEAAGGSVTFNGVWRVGGILAISRALGDAVLKQPGWLIALPDVYVIDLEQEPIDYVIVGSDGLWDVFNSEDAAEFVRPHMKENFFGAKKLAKEALRRGSTDNVCVMIVQFRDFGPPRSSA